MTSTQQPSRRIVFQGLGALGVAAALAGCGDDGGDGGSTSGDTTGTPSDTPTGGSKPTGGDGGGPAALATTSEIPVGGGIVLTDQRIVITQPTADQFLAFTAVCTHQGCTVSGVSDNVISCPCHGSTYDAATGDNIGGPAPAPLAEIKIRVKGTKIFEA